MSRGWYAGDFSVGIIGIGPDTTEKPRGAFHSVFWGREILYVNGKWNADRPRLRAALMRFPEFLFLLTLLGVGRRKCA